MTAPSSPIRLFVLSLSLSLSFAFSTWMRDLSYSLSLSVSPSRGIHSIADKHEGAHASLLVLKYHATIERRLSSILRCFRGKQPRSSIHVPFFYVTGTK